MADIIHRIGIKAPVSKVYAAVSTVEGIAGWWTRATTGQSKLGATFKVVFHSPTGSEVGKMHFDFVDLKADEAARWRCTSGPAEWIGTHVTFELAQDGDYTVVRFGHRDWREAVDFTAHCSMKWATFLLSLRDFIEAGQGKPAPDDLKIGDWH
jgi:uncharacterized protein YndB with AHSA1/START domain